MSMRASSRPSNPRYSRCGDQCIRTLKGITTRESLKKTVVYHLVCRMIYNDKATELMVGFIITFQRVDRTLLVRQQGIFC